MELPTLTYLDYHICYNILNHLNTKEVARLAGLGSHVWLSAAQNVLASRKEVVAELLEILEEPLRNRQAIRFSEINRTEDFKVHNAKQLTALEPRHHRMLTDLVVKPLISADYTCLPEDLEFPIQFRKLRLVCHTHGFTRMPPNIGLNFSTVQVEFCGFEADGSQELFKNILKSPNLTILRFVNVVFTENVVNAITRYIMSADWMSIEMYYKRRAPNFMADESLIRMVITSWQESEKSNRRRFLVYSTVTAEQLAELRQIAAQPHKVNGQCVTIAKADTVISWYVMLDIRFPAL